MQRIPGSPQRPPARLGRRPSWVPVAGLAVVLAVAGGVAFPPGGNDPAPTVAPLPITDDPDAAFQTRLLPLLIAAAGEARALVDLGESRSRNLFEIRSAQGRMEDRLAAVDTTLAVAPPPPHLAEAVAAYRSGAGTVRRAIGEAEAAFLRLDWDRVARATDLLDRGATLLDRATALLGDGSTASPPAPGQQ